MQHNVYIPFQIHEIIMALKLPKEVRYSFTKPPLWKRVFAYIIDAIIISIIVELPFAAVTTKAFTTQNLDFFGFYTFLISNPQRIQVIIITTLIIAILTLFYWSIFEYKLNQTIGKMLFKLYVKSEKGKLTYDQALIRSITKISFILLILDCIGLINSPKAQRFSERWSKTYVIDKSMMLK